MKKTKIIPRGKYILVKQDDEASRVTDSGLVIPDKVEQERKAVGTVKEVGPDIQDIVEGDRVIYGVFAGEKIQVREKDKEVEYMLLHDDDVLALII